MKKVINIYIRTDLRTSSNKKVPNGKMASQSAHALMGAFLALFENKGSQLVAPEENQPLLDAYLNGEIEYIFTPVKGKDELDKIQKENKEESIVIQDQGRTSFNEPTITTMAVSPKGYNYIKFINCNSEMDDRYRSKQVIVLNKEEIKDKWEMFNVVSQCSLDFLIDLVKESQNRNTISLEKEGLKNWVNGAFAKITIKPKETTFEETLEIKKRAEYDGLYTGVCEINNVIKCVSFGADSIEIIDKYTKEGYALA